MDFNSLRKNLKRDFSEFPKVKLAIVSDWATQMLAQAIRGYGYEVKWDFEIYEAAYDQMEAELYDSGSDLYKSNPDYILIFPCMQKLKQRFYRLNQKERSYFAEQECARIENFVNVSESNHPAKILLCNFTEENDMIMGSFGVAFPESFACQVYKLNNLIAERIFQKKRAYPVDLNGLQNQFGYENMMDERLYHLSKTIFKLEFLPFVAKRIIDVILASQGKISKCIIVDLDNTIWGGVIGDDGIENIKIGDFGIGAVFSDLQLWIKQLVDRGIILAVCSKNDHEKAIEPFEKHPDMILKLDDISVFMANWDDKANNIRKIQEILNIGFDSMVFIDDNPFERELVKVSIPEIKVPELPQEPSEYLSYLKRQNLFETISYTREDKNRTEKYREEAKRVSLKANFSNIDEYLISLDMRAEICRFDDFSIPRVSQLSQRSNQFNMRTVRYSEEDIKQITKSPEQYVPFYLTLKDKLGEYGIISVMILKILSSDTLFIDTFFMSCRVLKRGVEEFIFNSTFSLTKKLGYKIIIGEYIPTTKNQMVSTFYQDFGFAEKDGKWYLDIEQFQPKKTHVKGLVNEDSSYWISG